MKQVDFTDDIMGVVTRSLPAIIGQFSLKKQGCVVGIGLPKPGGGLDIKTYAAGTLSHDDASRYTHFAKEKIARTARLGHTSSWHSMNEQKGCFAGAIEVVIDDMKYYCSISAFQQLMDHSIITAASVASGHMTPEYARELATETGVETQVAECLEHMTLARTRR